MGRKSRVDRTAEEKWQIVQEGMKSGNVSEACRRYGIAQTLYYRWKDDAEQRAKAALGGKSAATADHQRDKASVRLAEVAIAVNALLEQLGETLELGPKVVGGRLKTLGLYTKRVDAMGRGLLLMDAIRNQIHRLAWGCRVVRDRDLLHCEYCKHFARLEGERKVPYDPLKGAKFSSQPDKEQKQPAVQPIPVPNRDSAKSDETGSSRRVETAEDRRLIDKLKKT